MRCTFVMTRGSLAKITRDCREWGKKRGNERASDKVEEREKKERGTRESVRRPPPPPPMVFLPQFHESAASLAVYNSYFTWSVWLVCCSRDRDNATVTRPSSESSTAAASSSSSSSSSSASIRLRIGLAVVAVAGLSRYSLPRDTRPSLGNSLDLLVLHSSGQLR